MLAAVSPLLVSAAETQVPDNLTPTTALALAPPLPSKPAPSIAVIAQSAVKLPPPVKSPSAALAGPSRKPAAAPIAASHAAVQAKAHDIALQSLDKGAWADDFAWLCGLQPPGSRRRSGFQDFPLGDNLQVERLFGPSRK
jgi:hypothetical protein